MGVKNLWDILDCCKKTLPLQHLQNKRVCVDLSCWMVQFQTACRSPACVKEKLYLQSLFHRLRALIALNCSLIFVTDGSIPAIKLTTYRRRLGTNSEAAGEEPSSHIVPSLRRNMGSGFSCMIKEAKALGMALGIPCLDGVEEAEAQCASLNLATLCDGCFTADSDIFLFGARTVYRDIFIGDSGYVVCYDMVDIEEKLGFGRNSLITLALLLGSDYSQGVRGFGPETASQLVKSIGDGTILNKIVSGQLTFSRTSQKTRRKEEAPTCDVYNGQDNVQNLAGKGDGESSDQFLEVINAYLKPKCHSPDSEAVKRVCVPLPFRHSPLQQICELFFHWDTDKTDQYILPKIAERNLRKFANFRTTSEELGVRISLQEMPVTCPAFTIIKQRKLHGRECFEVLWQDVGRLVTSTVSADLVKSACPEKVAEFMERKAEGKNQKRKPRLKKSEKAAVANVDLQLQSLMLSIESENEMPSNLTRPSNSLRSKEEADVIDLSTPSPPLRACKMAKCQVIKSRCINEADIASKTDTLLPEMMHGGFNAWGTAESSQDVRQCTNGNVVLLSQDERKLVECSETDAFVFEKNYSCHIEIIDASPVQPNGQKIDGKPGDPVVPNRLKYEEGLGHQIDVIDICDSENDASPEHQKKVRELRLFIDSIKDDLY